VTGERGGGKNLLLLGRASICGGTSERVMKNDRLLVRRGKWRSTGEEKKRKKGYDRRKEKSARKRSGNAQESSGGKFMSIASQSAAMNGRKNPAALSGHRFKDGACRGEGSQEIPAFTGGKGAFAKEGEK